MNKLLKAALAVVFLSTSALALAQAPSGSTGQCKDGSYTTNATKKGACAGHKGVQTWFADAAKPAPASTPAPAAKTASAAPMANAAPVAKPVAMTKPTSAAAPGGGAGQVWVNTETKVYHCPGTRYYGKTAKGAYMSESDAKAKGARPDAGKPCSGS